MGPDQQPSTPGTPDRRTTGSGSGSTAIGFRLGTHSSARPFIDVRLTVKDNTMRSLESQHAVPVRRRRDLDVPEMPMRGRGR